MRKIAWCAVVMAAAIISGPGSRACGAEDDTPRWAYISPKFPLLDAPRPAPASDPLMRVPDSSLALTINQTKEIFNVPDWHPDDHPPPPDVILHGHRRDLEACGHCHLPNGMGTNIIQAPSLAGLSVAYMLQQFADYRSGARKRAVAPFGPNNTMTFVLKNGEDADLRIAAEYFAALKPKPWFRVVETARVSQNVESANIVAPSAGDATVPIGMRIFEFPEDVERTSLRDSAAGFIAYVPLGSVKKGENLVTTGGKGTTTACATCHGPGLRGMGPVPTLAGRSPTYIVRELYNIQQGTRNGPWSALMAPVVSKLTTADMIAIAAYAASLMP